MHQLITYLFAQAWFWIAASVLLVTIFNIVVISLTQNISLLIAPITWLAELVSGIVLLFKHIPPILVTGAWGLIGGAVITIGFSIWMIRSADPICAVFKQPLR